MDKLDANLIPLIYNFLCADRASWHYKWRNKEYDNSINAWRVCSKYFSVQIGNLYFPIKNYDSKKICETYESKAAFRSFVHKYKLELSISNIQNANQLAYFWSFNVFKISFETKRGMKKQDVTDETVNLHCLLMSLGDDSLRDKIFTKPESFGSLYLMPQSLRDLKFDDSFDSIIYENVLPYNLETLTFGYSYNKPIRQNTLPPNLLQLEFGDKFNKSLDCNILPSTLETLIFGEYFNSPLTGALPPNLLNFQLGEWYSHEIPLLLATIQCLTLPDRYNKSLTPLNLSKLHNLVNFDLPNHFNKKINIDDLPPNLTSLHFGYYFNQPIEKHVLPTTLKILHFGTNFNYPLDDVLPPNLVYLTVSTEYTHEISTKLSIRKQAPESEYYYL